MDHVGRIFRPPSEADSLLLQVTVGCSHNECAYCAMYRLPEQRFRVKDRETIAADIREAADWVAAGIPVRRVFLCDGDALILPQQRLEEILDDLRAHVPSVRRIGIYGDARSILRRSVDELVRLRERGLGIVYHGVESGDDEVLAHVRKGSTRADALEAARRLREAGIRHSVIVMLGLGGQKRSMQHARRTASLLTEMDPPYVGALVTTLLPDTPLYDEATRGEFALPDRWDLLEELRIILTDARFTRCRFSANHASNYLPLSLNLPTDREKALELLHEVLERRDEQVLRPEMTRGL